ncbi:MAG: NACHT domain-containing protein [Gloeocapsa sp. UFS-A4-WI-NPMV-4B04]|jgi:predicted NACHT family NTPase|nr:NACHT domain-containing protein [Gloeocapsa sp. UFS-A4-WI-NPMV-4B04]
MTIRRSLRASPEGIEKARRALTQNSLTKKALAEEELKMSRSTVDKFFKGGPVDRRYFIPICERLNLEWDEIVVKPLYEPEAELSHNDGIDIDALVQQVRQQYHDRIQYQCGKMLLVNKLEVDLDDLCVDINILKDIPSQRYSNIFEKSRDFDPTSDDHDHFYLGEERYQRVPGLEVVEDHCKLLVLGKPGSGKTTFLQYVAINCDQGRLQSDRVPIFIKLFRYAEDTKENKLSLLNYIDREFCIQGIDHPQAAEILLQQGKCLILLDGLDEVPEVDSQQALKRVRQFCDRYHKNSIISKPKSFSLKSDRYNICSL